MRVWFSPQWGMNIDWLMQEPNAGASLKYWRALGSRLFLLDITSFSRWDSADQAACWLAALDLFWLDDPTLVWHPYFRNPTTEVYGAAHDARFQLHGQGPRARWWSPTRRPDDVVESVALADLAHFGAGGVSRFYDAETGEEIEQTGDCPNFRPPRKWDCPWPPSACTCPPTISAWCSGFRARGPLPPRTPWPCRTCPPQSSLDARRTVTALCRQLLVAPSVTPVDGGHRLTEAWVQRMRRPVPRPAGELRLPRPHGLCHGSIWATRAFRRPCCTTRSGKRCWPFTSIPRRPTAC